MKSRSKTIEIGDMRKPFLSTDKESYPIWKRYVQWKHDAYLFACIGTAGILFILSKMYPDFKLWLLTELCNPSEADVVSIYEGPRNKTIAVEKYVINDDHSVCSFDKNCVRYVASSQENWAVKEVPEVPVNFLDFLSGKAVSDGASRSLSRSRYGDNKMALPVASFWDILAVTVVHPFYLFQYFSVTIWMMDEYYLFSVIILLITAGAVYLATSETVFNLKRLHDLAGQSHPVTRINADGSTVVVPDTDLVPGDRFVVAQGGALPCDAVLLKGRVSIDESMLTGESVPVTKTPVDAKSIIDNDDLKKKTGHIMFSGTKILLCSEPSGEPCIAVTYRTGFRSAKGQLVGALLSAKDSFLGFFSDALWVILMMFIICTLLFVWSGVSLTDLGVDVGTCVFYYFTNITVAVPPTLTASLTVATSISIERLRKLGIFVSESTRVNWAGLVSMVCFDKTGTLTEERLHFKGFYVAKGLAESPEDTQPQIDVQAGTVEIDPADCNGFPVLCVELLATCHGLAMINDAPVGDPLEVELFRASGYVMVTTGSSAMIVQRGNSRLTIMRQFEFTADKLRAGSLILRTDGSMMYYVKGSPEAIIALSKKETVPESIGTELLSLSRRGLRIIAMGCVAFPADDHDRVMVASQAELEASVTFIGLAFLSNALKEDTIRTIETLRSASIPANMITGDHIYTAIAIAGDCGLITAKTVKIIDADPDIKSSAVQILSFETGEIEPIQLADALGAGLAAMRTATAKNPVTMQLAITGRGLEAVKQNYSALLPDLVYVVRVFARMKPADKQFIVEELLKEDEKLDVSPPTAGTTISDPEVGITNPMVRQDAGYDSSNHISRLSASVMELGDLLGNGRGQMLVMFCGDGANDMAALRAATVGVSLCEAETSVAAPLTSRLQTPYAVVETIKEGRCSLITAYVLVCFTLEYAMVQLFMASVMFSYGLKVGPNTYLIHDLFFTLVLALAISRTPPQTKLGKEIPPQRFFTKYFIFKLFSQLACFPAFQLIALRSLSSQSWYEKYDPNDDDPLNAWYATENSVVAFVGLVQVMIASVVSTIGAPFRMPWYSNYSHLVCLFLQGIFVVGQLFATHNAFTSEFLDIKPMPTDYCFLLVFIMLCNIVVSVGLEVFGSKYLM